MNSPVEVWLWLLLVMQPNNPKTNEILSQYNGDAVRASRAIRDDGLPILTENEKKRALETRNDAVRRLLDICGKNDIRIVTLDDSEYPLLLKSIEDPPIVLFVKGSLEGLDSGLVISAVGTKRPSEYSLSVTDSLVGTLSEGGAVFISGNADGLDSAVHRACIKAGGRSVAVLPCGILSEYPKGSKALRAEILDNGGALISELFPYTKAAYGYFHHRNRIISGLSPATVVLQAGGKSGALDTANYAVKQNRMVFYIPPHDIFSEEYSGSVTLDKKDAVPIFGCFDLLDKLGQADPSVRIEFSKRVTKIENKAPEKRKAESENVSIKEQPEYKTQRKKATEHILPESLLPDEKMLAELITKTPADIDTLMDKSGLDYGAVIGALTSLELSGVISRQMDGIYTLS